MTTPESLFLALDQGTTSSRAILFDQRGLPVATAQQEFRQITPAPGVVEHDAGEIWESQLATARKVIDHAGIRPESIAAVGIANQRETTVLWDRTTGQPVASAIVWQSRISEPVCRRMIDAGHEEEIRRLTGLRLDPYFSATKIVHLLETVDGLEERCRRGEVLFGTVDSWLVWKFTGGRVHATDPSNAGRTLLFDIHQGQWSERLCDLFGIPMEMLPEVRPSAGDFGVAGAEMLGCDLPIRGVAGDQQAAAYGQGCLLPGQAKNTYGTGAFLLFATGHEAVASQHGLLTTPAADDGGGRSYFLEGAIFVAGAIVSWLRDGLGIIEKSSDIEPLAARVESTEGVVVVPALTGLGTPHWDPHARGLIIGLTRGSNAAHIARAALQSIALQVSDVVECMRKDSGISLDRLRVDGGASSNNLLMQMQADVLGVPVERPRVLETTALGAALLAARGGGHENAVESEAARQTERVFEPTMGEAARNELLASWQDAVGRARGWTSRGHASE
jgi:glycerol kinase